MSVMMGILEEERKRLEELLDFYRKKIEEAPRGSISAKERGGRRYLYLARREGEKVIFDYVGRDVPEVRDALDNRIHQRREYQAKLRQVRENLKEVKRALRGKRT
ncbi:MAG: hypothetical protein ABSA71_15480 [Desulfomonilia bacterium]|jgi:hypothetical protein